MRTYSYAIIVAIGLVAAARAENPLFSYQGRLLGSDGQPVNESVTMAVNIYTSAVAGAAVYSEQVGTILVQNGIYSFSYGTNISALRVALGSEESWLELVINSTALSPRQRLHYTPYAISLDENSLVQSTQFLLDMIAKHELEIQALRAQAGLMNTSGGDQYFTETFSDADGQNNLVDTALTDAVYAPADGIYRPWSALCYPHVLLSSNCELGSTAWFVTSNRPVHAVGAEVRRTNSNLVEGVIVNCWTYSDFLMVSNFFRVVCSNDSWQTVTMTNGRPESDVLYVFVEPRKVTNCFDEGGLEVRNTTVFLGSSTNDHAQLVLNIPPMTGQLSHVALFANMDPNTNPDLIEFNLTDGSTTISNVNLGRKFSTSTLSNNPTKLFISLQPSPTNYIQDPAVESVMFKWWY